MTDYIREYDINELLDLYRKYDSNEDHIALIVKAYNYASDAIGPDKRRITGEKYISHAIRVGIILTDLYSDYISLAATLLHEMIIEEKKDIIEIEQEFGSDVALLVEGITKISHLNFSASTESMIQSQRKIFVGLAKDVRVIIIKLADRLDNMRTLSCMPEAIQKQKAKETLEILTPIAHRLGLNKIKGELEDLSLKYGKREAYDDVVAKLAKSEEERNKAVLKMKEELIEILENAHLKYEIKGRSKSIYSIYKKLDKGRMFKDIYDLLALRILIENEQDCYFVLGLIHAKYKHFPNRFKDYIAMPKNNMYQSLHTTIFGHDNNVFEIQIRTYEMNELAERGIASHWSYKEKGKNNKVLKSMEQKLELFRSVIESNEETTDPNELLDTVKNEILNEYIYVYTPNGDVIELPNGSTPVDFAYRVHSKIGEAIIGAIVNDNIVPLSYQLESGDIVKINTTKKPTGPKVEWLSFVKTSQAKDKIKAYFTRCEKETYINKGSLLLEKELRKKKLEFSILNDNAKMTELLESLKLKDLTELHHAIGSNRITAGFVINFLTEENDSKDDLLLKRVMNAETKEVIIKNDIIVEGIDEIKATLAKCCMPIYGDDITGYITKGEGISVHRTDCHNVYESERLIDVKWNLMKGKKYKASLIIEADKTDNGLINIINKASTNDISIESVNTNDKGDYISYDLIVLTFNVSDLEKYISSVTSLPFIIRVERSVK